MKCLEIIIFRNNLKKHLLNHSPYAAAKLYAHSMVKIYRKGYGLFACNGILFNHESPLRGRVSDKENHQWGSKNKPWAEDSIELGNIDAKRVWGFADYPNEKKILSRKLKLDR